VLKVLINTKNEHYFSPTGRLKVGDATKIQPSTNKIKDRHFAAERFLPNNNTAKAAVVRTFN
jgi:hypothetical protein